MRDVARRFVVVVECPACCRDSEQKSADHVCPHCGFDWSGDVTEVELVPPAADAT